MGNIRRVTAAALGMAATASVVPIAGSATPAAANHNGCQSGWACFWQVGGAWGGQFTATSSRLNPPFPAYRGYNHGTSGLRACGFREVNWGDLEFSIPQNEYRQRGEASNTVVSSSKWVAGTCS